MSNTSVIKYINKTGKKDCGGRDLVHAETYTEWQEFCASRFGGNAVFLKGRGYTLI